MSEKHATIPTVHILQSLASQNFNWEKALGEFIDNSLDAGARNVTIEVLGKRDKRGGSTKVLRITDDGRGMERPGLLVCLGDRQQHGTTKLGMYGVGSKDAAFWIGGAAHKLYVSSVCGGASRRLDYNWNSVLNEGRWLDAESSDPVPTMDPSGTTIAIYPIARDVPSGKAWHNLAARIGYTFAPAINSGVTIRMKHGDEHDIVLTSYALPAFDGEAVDVTADVDGKRIRVKCGLVRADSKNTHPGLTYYHRHRVLWGPTHQGCGDYSTGRIAGVVSLVDGWTLTKNKDGISKFQDRLFEVVESIIKPILERASVVERSTADAEFLSAVEATLNAAAFGPANPIGGDGDHTDGEPNSKAVRGKGTKKGTVEPKSTGRRHRRAARVQPGGTFYIHERRFTRLTIAYANLDPSELGTFSPNGTVTLNSEHPHVARARTTSNHDAIVGLACAVAAYEDSTRAAWAKAFEVDPDAPSAPKQILAEFLRRVSLVPANDTKPVAS